MTDDKRTSNARRACGCAWDGPPCDHERIHKDDAKLISAHRLGAQACTDLTGHHWMSDVVNGTSKTCTSCGQRSSEVPCGAVFHVPGGHRPCNFVRGHEGDHRNHELTWTNLTPGSSWCVSATCDATEPRTNEARADYSWIKVKRHVDDPSKSWEERFRALEKHHEAESKFLVAEVEKLREQRVDKATAAVNDDLRIALNIVAAWLLHDFKAGTGEHAAECAEHTPDKMRNCGREKHRHPISTMLGRFCLKAIEAAGEQRTDYPRIEVGSRVCLAKVAGTVARRSENDPTAWRVTWPSGTQTSHRETDLMIASDACSANPKATP